MFLKWQFLKVVFLVMARNIKPILQQRLQANDGICCRNLILTLGGSGGGRGLHVKHAVQHETSILA
jgi:hypothetical protein